MAFLDLGWTAPVDEQSSLEVTNFSSGYRVRMTNGPSLWSKSIFFLRRFVTGRAVLQLDTQARVLHRSRATVFGRDRDRKTTRFEEIKKIEIEIASSLRDALAGRGHCDGAKLILRRDGRSVTLLRGDISELEQIATRIRRDTGAR